MLVLAKRNKNAWKDNDSFASKEFGSQVLNIYDRTENVENPREISLLESLAVAADQDLAKKLEILQIVKSENDLKLTVERS